MKRHSYVGPAEMEAAFGKIAATTYVPRLSPGQRRTLELMADWPDAMPPLNGPDAGLLALQPLARAGLARIVAGEDPGEPRFLITPKGLAALRAARAFDPP